MTMMPPADSVDPASYPSTVLIPGEEHIYTISAEIASTIPPAITSIGNEACVTVAGLAIDTNSENNCSSTTTALGNFTNVWIEKEGPVIASLGQTITYTLNYGNNGNALATDVVITDALSAGLQVGTISIAEIGTPKGWTCTYDSNTHSIRCDGGISLLVGETGSIQITGTVSLDPVLAYDDPATVDVEENILNTLTSISTTSIESNPQDNTADYPTQLNLADL